MSELTLTAMTPQVRRAGRVSLELDGGFWRGASLEAVAELGLRVGMRIDERRRQELEEALEVRRAFESALRMLAARGRTATELAQRLARKGYGDEHAQAAIGRCRSLGLMDDEAVVRSRAETLRARGAGPRRARAELERLTGERELTDQVVADCWPAHELAQIACTALARHARPERLRTSAERRRALSWLMRQGHAMDDARAAIAAIPAAEDEERSTAPARPAIDPDELAGQLARRFPGAASDARVRQRAYGWAARRGASHDDFRQALAAASEAAGN